MIIKIFIAILLAMIGLGIDVDRLRVTEFVRAPIGYLALVWVLSWIPGLSRLRRLHLNSRVIFLILFAAVMSAQAVSHIVDTEIPRLKVVLRFIYFVYVIVITSSWGARIPRLPLALGTILLFTAFPYNWSLNWTYIMGTIRSLPLFLGVLYLFVDEKVYERLRFRDPFTWLPALILAAFTIANILNHNYVLGAEWLLRLLVAFLLFQIVRLKSEDLDARSVIRLLLILAGVHGVFFLTSIVFGLVGPDGVDFIVDKRTHIAGVNTNDISGYLIVVLPLFPAMLLDGRIRPGARSWLVWVLFILTLSLLIVVKARAAWPVAVLSMLLLFLLLKRNNIASRARRIMGAGAVLLLAGAALFFLAAHDTRIVNELLDANTLRIRLAFWKLAAWLVVNNPLNGVGALEHSAIASIPVLSNVFPPDSPDHSFFVGSLINYIHSHNMILQLWLDGGVVFMFALIGFFLLVLHGGLQRDEGPDRALRMGACVALTAMFLQGFINYHFMDFATWLPVWFIMGLLARGKDQPAAVDAGTAHKAVGLTLLALTLVLSAYGGFLLYNQADALNTMKHNRGRDARKNIVLLPDEPALDVANIAQASKSIGRAYALAPGDRSMAQLAGEFAYFGWKQTGRRDYEQRAQARLQACIQRRPYSALCRARLAELLKKSKPGHEARRRRLLREAAELDPLNLRSQTPAKRF